MRRYFPFLLISIAIAALVLYFIFSGQPSGVVKKLPILGNHRLDSVMIGNGYRIDTIYHSIQPFKFINQDGKTVDQSIVNGKVYVADFFFTTCQTICPVMSKQLDRVYDAYKDENNLMILSFTVDPETDTAAQLKRYAQSFDANTKRWVFLTGEKPALYDLARTGYLLNNEIGTGGPDDFIHTQNFALIDKKGRIRGFYDGTLKEEVDRLIVDARFLLNE